MSQASASKPLETVNVNGQQKKFGMRDKVGYMFGDWGNDFFFILVAAFLMVYYTDVFKLNPAFVGTLFLIARIWDAFSDVAWGRFIDSRKSTKNGKFRPWIFRMSFPLVIVGVLMFVHIPGLSSGFYEAYAFVTYILWGTLYSSVNIPYGSMASVITADPVERTTLSTFRSLGGALAGLIITVIGPLVLFVNNKADATHFMIGAIIFGILSLACYMACYSMTIERIPTLDRDKSKGNFGRTMKGIGKNRPLLWLLVLSLIFLICFMLVSTINVYLFKNYFDDAKALSIVGLVQTGTLIIAMPLIKPLVARFGKKELASTGLLLATIVYGLLYILAHLTATQFIVILAFGMFGFNIFNLLIWAFVTDALDYHEYVTGLREDGTIYAIYSFARKVGQAVAGGLGGYALAAVGYSATKQTQTQATLNGIHTLATLVPAIFLIIVFLILVFLYPLNKKRTNQLTTDLQEKRMS